MNQQWTKLGQLYDPSKINGRHPKLLSHAANPLPVHLTGNIYRIFYSGRDAQNRSSVGAVDIDIHQQEIIQDHYSPFFKHGPKGSFFADGVSIGNCYQAGSFKYMLFMGWQTPPNNHWRGDIGRLIVAPDLTLSLDSEEPFMASDLVDSISLSYPWVLPKSADEFDMWYGSTQSWDAGNGEMLHVIKHAISNNGHIWRKTGQAIPHQLGIAQAFSRPTVIHNKDGEFDMWFSYRNGTGQKYRIGYAKSINGENWRLALEQTGIDVSETGWDSDMIEYPYVFDHAGKRYMLYNGNGYGKTGFGLAVLDGY